MGNKYNREILDLIRSIQDIDYILPKDIPNIELYMDQITTFMDEHLQSSKRFADDKILTKTMINNYAKNNLLPPPAKKKYSKEHILALLFIYYFKSLLSISDIQNILNPITDKYFGNTDGLSLQDIYNEVFGLEHEEIQHILKDLAKKYKTSLKTFEDVPEDEAEPLHKFAFICMLSFDVYIKKMIIEQTIDKLAASSDTTKKSKRTSSKTMHKEKE